MLQYILSVQKGIFSTNFIKLTPNILIGNRFAQKASSVHSTKISALLCKENVTAERTGTLEVLDSAVILRSCSAAL